MKNNFYLIRFGIITLFFFLAGAVSAQDLKKGETSVRFKSGLTIIFRSETEPAISGKQSRGIVSIKSGSNVINRIFVDEERGMYYGYDLEVEPAAQAGKFKLTVKQLSASPNLPPEALRRVTDGGVAGGRNIEQSSRNSRNKLTALPLPKYPEPQLLEIGDTLALDVLVNRQTGVKVVDFIRLTPSEVDESAAASAANRPATGKGGNAAADFTINEVELQMVSSRLLVNKEIVFGGEPNSRMAVSGALIWFYLPGKGRFILSLSPREGFNFKKIGTIENNQITFSINGDTYEWISSLPIVANMNGRWNLWVQHDPQVRPSITFGQADSYLIGAGNPSAFDQKKK